MLTKYRITLAYLILSLGSSAHASQLLNDEDTLPKNTKVHKSDLNPTQRSELERRIFWILEKNPTLPENTIKELIKNAYDTMGVQYNETTPPATHTFGCQF
ncbi:MAG: hypothetical protein K2X53_01995 [Alphaproteobacteria bacterium]|nr:hypothetical protein [Alphaproteobacteria bacterium]